MEIMRKRRENVALKGKYRLDVYGGYGVVPDIFGVSQFLYLHIMVIV